MEDIDEAILHLDYWGNKIQIGAKLDEELRTRLIEFLKENYCCFAWTYEDMTGIDPEVVVHRLQLDLDYPPVKQKRRMFAPEWNNIINTDI